MPGDFLPGDLYYLDGFKCLRGDYAKNECSLCLEICPQEAIGFERKKLTLFHDRCINCAVCMGICPTQALSSETFDPDKFCHQFVGDEETLLSCKSNLPCLAALSSEHYIALSLESSKRPVCDMAHCDGCELNPEGKTKQAIVSIIEEANRFLCQCGKEPLDLKTDAQETEERRGFLKRIMKQAAHIAHEEDMSFHAEHIKEVPLKRTRLQRILKEKTPDSPENDTLGPFSFVASKAIDAMACTNCQDCAQFCPTGALSVTGDNRGIFFQVGKCIRCGICHDVCKPDAIRDTETFSLVDFAFGRMQLLVEHTLVACIECRVTFPYKGGEKVCDRCRDFRNNFSDMFILAKDL